MSHQHPLSQLPRPKRAYHKKSRTGCITCKIRKLRCDEQKPECDRCVSTGRKCDGYAPPHTVDTKRTNIDDTAGDWNASTQSANATSCVFRPFNLSKAVPHHPAKELKLALSRSNLDELRSYRYFLEVSAPSLAGVFHDDFWLGEIPRACQADPAIWHAVVSLGAAYEAYANPRDTDRQGNFALKQYNSSIKCLTEASSRREDKWRALTVSVIFTCICTIQGLHKESRMHLLSGCKLLRELEEDMIKRRNRSTCYIGPHPPSQGKTLANNTSPSIPVSMGPVRAILINFDTQARAMDNGGLSQDTRLIADNDSFNNWRMYSAPCRLSEIPLSLPSSVAHPIVHATQENLLRANRAAESLLSGMIIFSQIHASMIGEILTAGKVGHLDILISRQEPFTRCFAQLSIALRIFKLEMDMSSSYTCRQSTTELTKALLTLALFHSTIRLLLFRDPEIPDQILRAQGFPAHYSSIVDMVERIIQLDVGKTVAFTPTPSIGSPLSLVALVGSPNSTRRRALELMRRYPRREGLWDTSFTVKLVETVMAHEQSLLRQAAGGSVLNSSLDKGEADANAESEEDMTVPPLLQMYSMRVSFEGRRQAIVALTTWQEWLTGKQGQSITLTW